MKKELEINPLKGFGSIRFGATRNEIQEKFGEPGEIEKLEGESDESDAEAWNYWEIGHTFFFEKDSDYRCTCVETDNDEVKLFGKEVFLMSEDQIIKLMNDNGFTELDTENEEWGERRVSFNDAVMDFYFEDENLVSVSWGVIADENDIYNWPE